LARSILYQQLAGSAAQAIHGRLVEALEGQVTPERILSLGPAAMAACGLSRAKAAALFDLAQKVADGTVALDRMGRLSDDQIITELVAVRGIGPWTAQMFLLSSLRRLDVWPVGDLGVRNGFARAWELRTAPSPAELELLGERYRPYRSLVAWYCWRAADEDKAAPTPLATDVGTKAKRSVKKRTTAR
jgi:3-methyladenine DNA glycosylase/8-oxoguanine DNA glycosylase